MPFAPKIVILAVYKTDESNHWRGFCSPYDVTCTGNTPKETMRKLEKLVGLYEEGLKEYDYPKHLAIKKLSDPDDQKVLGIILEEISEKIKQQMRNQFLQFQRSHRKRSFRQDNVQGIYYQPQMA